MRVALIIHSIKLKLAMLIAKLFLTMLIVITVAQIVI